MWESTKSVTDSLGSWARIVVILPLMLLETVLDAVPVLSVELMMLVRRLKWIVHEKLRLFLRPRPHR